MSGEGLLPADPDPDRYRPGDRVRWARPDADFLDYQPMEGQSHDPDVND